MITRLAAAAVGLAILLPAVIFGGELAVEIIVPLVALLIVYEYAAMAFPDDRPAQQAFLSVGVLAPYAIGMYAGLAHWGPALLGAMVAAMIWTTLRPGPELSGAADRFGRLAAGIGWLSLLGFLPWIRRFDQGLSWVFVVLAISWLGDTGGYFAGRFFGKTPLYPRISPKKTREGVVGGMALATAGMFVARAVALPALTVVDCLVLGIVVCGAGVLGDLGESMLKRAFEVKDAGNILPGHGGMLDRIDSVMFVAPLVYGYVVLVGRG